MRDARPGPAFDELRAALGPPADHSREGRIALLAEVFQALVDGRMPSRAAAKFVGACGMAWLQQGGSLEKRWRVQAQAGSHWTPAKLFREMAALTTARDLENPADLPGGEIKRGRTARRVPPSEASSSRGGGISEDSGKVRS